jgi:hypothetical protein
MSTVQCAVCSSTVYVQLQIHSTQTWPEKKTRAGRAKGCRGSVGGGGDEMGGMESKDGMGMGVTVGNTRGG